MPNNISVSQKLSQSFFYLLITSGALLYYFFQLTNSSLWLMLILSTTLSVLLAKKFKWRFTKPQFTRPHFDRYDWLTQIALLASWGFGLWLLWQARTSDSISSPWQKVPLRFFIFYLSATVLVARCAWRNTWGWRWAVRLHYLFSLSIGVIVYKLGQGFDPFIHQAAVRYISEHGFVLPKTIYYAGQYSLETLLHKFGHLPLSSLDAWLIPVAAAWLLPTALENTAARMFADERAGRLMSLALLLTGFGLFTMSTPQSLAFLLAATALLLSLVADKRDEWTLAYLAGLAAFLTHPLAGIPALITIVALQLRQSRWRHNEILFALLFVITATAIPAAFYWLERQSFDWLHFLANLGGNLNISLPTLPNGQNWLLNFVYLIHFNRGWIFAGLSLAGLLFVMSRARRTDLAAHVILASQASALLLAYLLTNALNFNYLIDYERSNFANRLLLMSAIVASPLALILLYEFTKRWQKLKSTDWLKLGLSVVLLSLAGANLYLAYPRVDNWYNSHGFSISQQDLAAVDWISQDGRDLDYTVLANQQVGAAALRQFGFAKYYPNNIFYYPIPTSGPLYQLFLAMSKEPSRQVAEQALALTGAQRVYFVVNDYWWGSDKIIKLAAVNADRVEERPGATILVYNKATE
jgi:hypothetical protein